MGPAPQIAFVILREAKLPDPKALLDSLRDAASDEPGAVRPVNGGESGDGVLSYELPGGRRLMVALVPAPVPGREAEVAAGNSFFALSGGWRLEGQAAHLVITGGSPGTQDAVDQLHRFTREVAAVARVSRSVAVYWGQGPVTHPADEFIESAFGDEPPVVLWVGLSTARPRHGVVSLESLGMQQLGVPDLMIESPAHKVNEALGMLFDLLLFTGSRGKPIADADTVGRTAEERLRVEYVQSPLDPARRVMRVRLPD